MTSLAFLDIGFGFVRSGYVYPPNGVVNSVGANAYGWSRVTKSLANAYNLGVNPTNVGPSNNNNRYHGFPLRCRLCPCGVDLLVLL